MEYKTLEVTTISIEPDFSLENTTRYIIEQINSLKLDNPNLDLIVYGETILNKYRADNDYFKSCAQSLDSDTISLLQSCCKQNSINLSIGIVENDNGALYNSQLLINRNGEIVSIHRKSNLTASESKVFNRGTGYITYCDIDGITIATSICYDAFHSKCKNALQNNPPHIFIHSLADPLNPHFATGYNGRATSSYYISANRYGKEKTTFFCGHISIVCPWGKILRLEHGSPNIIIENIKININPSSFIIFLRKIANAICLFFHLIRHIKKVVEYLKWDSKMKKSKKS